MYAIAGNLTMVNVIETMINEFNDMVVRITTMVNKKQDKLPPELLSHTESGGLAHSLVNLLEHGFMSSDDKLKLDFLSKWFSVGSTLDRPIVTEGGHFRFNTDFTWFEGFNGDDWYSLGGTPIGTLFILDYSTVGEVVEPITAILTPPPTAINSVVSPDYSGIWASTLVVPRANSAITSLSFNNLQGLTGTLSISGLAALSLLKFPELKAVMGGFSTSNLAGLTNVSCPLLTVVVGNFNIASNVAFAIISIPSLISVHSNFSLSTLAGATTVNFSSLTNVGGNFSLDGLDACTSVGFPNLTEIKGRLSISTAPAITNLTFSSLEKIGSNLTEGNAISIGPTLTGLTVFKLSNSVKEVNGSVYINCPLSGASVDALLAQFVSLDGSNGTTLFANENITISGTSVAPSASGLASKAILEDRGCTVYTN
jgi:hypothetical protein